MRRHKGNSDFIVVRELAAPDGITPFTLTTLYTSHTKGHGAMSEILTKCGGKLGVWRADYELWRDSQRRLRAPAPSAATL